MTVKRLLEVLRTRPSVSGKIDNVCKVEKILKTIETLSGGKQHYIQYQIWPPKYNEWIDESSLFPI